MAYVSSHFQFYFQHLFIYFMVSTQFLLGAKYSSVGSCMHSYADEPNIMKYIKIAATLRDKTVRDVAMRCRWMTVSSSFLKADNVFRVSGSI